MSGRRGPVNFDNFEQVIQLLTPGRTLDVGSGNVHPHADVTIDADPDTDPDVVADLREGIPFDDDEFENVTAVHVIEHLADDVGLWKDMQRVASQRAIAVVPIGARDDPTHQHIYMPEDITERFDYDHRSTSSMGGFYDAVFSKDV